MDAILNQESANPRTETAEEKELREDRAALFLVNLMRQDAGEFSKTANNRWKASGER